MLGQKSSTIPLKHFASNAPRYDLERPLTALLQQQDHLLKSGSALGVQQMLVC